MKPTDEDKEYAQKLMEELEMLSEKPHTMSFQEANQIVIDFGRILACICESKCFPVYRPDSLLPREKKFVIEAFAVCFKHSLPNTEERHTLYMGYQLLKLTFIEDEMAFEKNQFLLADPTYWKAMKKA